VALGGGEALCVELLGVLRAAGGVLLGTGIGLTGGTLAPGASACLAAAPELPGDDPPLGVPVLEFASCCSESGAPNVRVVGMNVGADVVARNSSARCTSAKASRALIRASDACSMRLSTTASELSEDFVRTARC
jgi:hypothetical protein